MKFITFFSLALLLTSIETLAANKCSKAFVDKLPATSSSNFIVLDRYNETLYGLEGKTVSIEFEDGKVLREIVIKSFKILDVKMPNGLLRRYPSLTYLVQEKHNGRIIEQEFELPFSNLANIKRIGLFVDPSASKNYDSSTKGWTEYHLDHGFHLPEFADGTLVPNQQLLNKTVSLLVFPLINGQNNEKKSRIITGTLIEWPLYQKTYYFTIRTESGEIVQVYLNSVRRFKVKSN